jgi:iron complex transport system ATP-binding protein
MIAPPPISAQGIAVRVPGRAILDDVALTLTPGSMTVLLGPNGSGKTTLIRVLAGVLKQTSGTVLLGGTPQYRLTRSEIARIVAYLPQQTNTTFAIRVEDAVALGRYPHTTAWGGMTRSDFQHVTWAMDRVGITALRNRTLPTLSGGERQRVFIARALAQGASILLLDEPIAALDIGRQLELMGLLGELHQEGHTILAALHDLRPAADYFQEAILLDAGKLTAKGTVNDVIFGAALAKAFGVSVRKGEQVLFEWIG